MEHDERELMMTAAWMFARHGQRQRALPICAALNDDSPSDGVVAAVYADMLLEDGNARRALNVLRAARMPTNLERSAALLESRALVSLGRRTEAERCWKRYVDKSHGVARTWVAR